MNFGRANEASLTGEAMYNAQMIKLGSERSVIREIFEYGNARAAQIGRENVFDFSIGNPNVPAPESVTQELKRLIDEMPPEKLHGYTSAAGLAEVRSAVADYLVRTFGAPMRSDLIYMTCGAAASLIISFSALAEEGDEFVVVAPYFPEYAVFIRAAGGIVRTAYAGEDFHLDMASLDAAIGPRTKAVVINSPNNPSGAVYSAEELSALADLLRRKSAERGAPVFLISDEPYRELVYDCDVPYVANFYDDTIICYSFSKSLSLPGERIGYVAVSARCKDAEQLFSAVCGAGRFHGFVCAPALFQRVIAANLGKSSDVAVYRGNRDILYAGLTRAGFSCVMPEGAFYLFMRALGGDAAAFCERAKRYELLLVPSDSFGVEGYVRISYCVSRETIERSLPAFAALAKEYFRR